MHCGRSQGKNEMELRQLQSLVAVVKYKSFTKAAEILYISQPTISTHIRMLEEELEYRLIIRNTKSIQVTPKGMELYECACKMLALKDGLMERWAEENQKVIRLGASTIPADYILPEILPLFRSKAPDVQFHISQSDSKKILEGITNGKYSLGMVGMEIQSEEIIFIPFYRDEMVMITPPEGRFRKINGTDQELRDLILHEPVIMREQGSGSKKCIEAYFESMNMKESELLVVAKLNDQESIKKLVAGGLGISFISRKAVEEDYRTGKVQMFSLPGAAAKRNLYLAYRKDYVLKNYVAQFIDFLIEFYDESRV